MKNDKENIMYPKELDFAPSVFAVGNKYIICVSCSKVEATVCVKTGGRTYYDASNGILRSKKYLHMVELPQSVLDGCGEYTIVLREFIERKPYFPTSKEPVEYTVKFSPVKDCEEINICYISDTHGQVDIPANAGLSGGVRPDILVMGGDCENHSGDIENFKMLFNIAGNVSGGNFPCIFTRGNHDMRGQYAEILSDYTPTNNGLSYYSVRLGPVWALVLDCGEDKVDEQIEYGHTIACHDFRLRETEFIKEIIENRKSEYEADGVKHVLLMSHIPFARKCEEPFNPADDIYTEWCGLLRAYIKPELWLVGHRHLCEVLPIGGESDNFGQPCPVIIGSKPDYENGMFTCAFISVSKKGNTVFFADNYGNKTQPVKL